MPVTNQQMLEQWNDMPVETRSQTIATFHVAVVEGALEKATIARQRLDFLRGSGEDMSQWVMFIVHKDERQTLLKLDKDAKFGPDQTFFVDIRKRSRVASGKMPAKYREKFEYVKTHGPNPTGMGRLLALTVMSGNAFIHTVDLDRDEEILKKKAAEAEAKAAAEASAIAALAAPAETDPTPAS